MLINIIDTGTLERAGCQTVDHAVGIVFRPQIVSVAHRMAQIFRVAFNNDRLCRSEYAQQSPVELHVRAHIFGLAGYRSVQVYDNIIIIKFNVMF